VGLFDLAFFLYCAKGLAKKNACCFETRTKMFNWFFGSSSATAAAAPAVAEKVVEEKTVAVVEQACTSTVEPTTTESAAPSITATAAAATTATATTAMTAEATGKTAATCCDVDCACGGMITQKDCGAQLFICRQCGTLFQNPTELVKHRLVCVENAEYRSAIPGAMISPDNLDETRLQMQRLHSLGTGLTAAKKAETRASVMSLYSKRKPAISTIATESISTDVERDKLASMRNEQVSLDDARSNTWPSDKLPTQKAADDDDEISDNVRAPEETTNRDEEIILRHGVQKLAVAGAVAASAVEKIPVVNDDADNDFDPVDEREQQQLDEAAFHEQQQKEQKE
jgi:hypothetical protein